MKREAINIVCGGCNQHYTILVDKSKLERGERLVYKCPKLNCCRCVTVSKDDKGSEVK